MAQILQTIDVDVPVTTSYNQWTQFESFPHFLHFVKRIEQLDDTHVRWTVEIAGAERTFDTEISEQLPDERVAWKSDGGDEVHAGVVTFHKLSDTTSRLAVQIDWEAKGLLEKLGAAVGVDNHAVKKSLKDFKEFIEDEGNANGGWRGTVDRDA